MTRHQAAKVNNDRGATLVLVAICLTMVVGFAALAIDIGSLYAARNELQNVADAAALAAARKLGSDYESIPSLEEQRNYICDKAVLVSVAQSVAAQNKVAGTTITISPEDVLVGHWSMSEYDDNWCIGQPTGPCQSNPAVPKIENLNNPDAVNVTVRRDGTGADGPISTIFAQVLGIETMNVSATATAALTGKSKSGPGELIIPVGISRYWFDNNSCNDRIRFSPSNDPLSCAGWNTYTYDPPNDNRLGEILQENPKYPSPETVAGKTKYEFIGGTMSANTFDDMMLLFKKYGYDQDEAGNDIIGPDGEPLHDATGHPDAIPLCQYGKEVKKCVDPLDTRATYPDDKKFPTPRNKHHWQTYVVVYDWPNCSNPNDAIEIIGFAEIDITDVVGPPENILEGIVLCDYVDPNGMRSGGGNYGLKGSIPGLVE